MHTPLVHQACCQCTIRYIYIYIYQLDEPYLISAFKPIPEKHKLEVLTFRMDACSRLAAISLSHASQRFESSCPVNIYSFPERQSRRPQFFSLLFHFFRAACLVAGSSWVSLSVCMSQSRLFFLLQPLLLLGCSCSVIRVLFHLLFFLLQLQEIWPTQLDSRWRRRMANGNNL